VRAYATNSVGTAYGSVLSFKTSASTPCWDKAIKEVLLLTFPIRRFRVHFRRNSWFNYNYVKPEYRDSMGLFRNFN
jgi:hypothetical protein